MLLILFLDGSRAGTPLLDSRPVSPVDNSRIVNHINNHQVNLKQS